MPSPDGGDPLARTKRTTYVIAALLAVPIDVLGWLRLSEEPAIAAAYGVFALGLVVVAALMASPLRLAVAERIALVLIAGGFLGRLAVVVFLTPDPGAELGEIITSLLILCSVHLIAFLSLPRLAALAVACSVLLASLAMVGGRLLLGSPTELPHSGMPLIKAFVMQGIFVTLLYILAVTKEEMSASHARAQTLAEIASTDPLTGVANRRQLSSTLARHAADATRTGRTVSVVLLDLDHFKVVNDTYGHAAGDGVLRHVGAILTSELRANDLFGRWGGEEFLIVAVDCGPDAAEELAVRCRQRLHDAPPPDTGPVTASFGVATLRPGDDWESVVGAADRAMYEAKAGGRDRVVAQAATEPV